MKLRVVSYNVLSSHLSAPSHYSTLNPEHLDPQNRLPAVLNKLEKQVRENKNCIICLQEVSYDWAGAFHTFFATKGYHLVTGLYGKKFNGYMGVALAWPTESLETVAVDISRLSDTREGGWPAPDEKSVLSLFWENVQAKLGYEKPKEHWEYAEWRQNVLLTATLRDKVSGQAFCIGNYHMPCAFFAPRVMTIHSEMAVAHVQRIANKANLPCILAGDFNIKPQDACYRFLTTGKIDEMDLSYPTPKNGYEWKPSSKPMQSAYAAFLGAEPDFTNYARIKENDPFIDTLDYIFLSQQWKVLDIHKLPHRDESGGPFPNLEKGEPSDHLLIASNLELHEQ